MDMASDYAGAEQRIIRSVASALLLAESEINADTSFGSIPQWDSMGHMSVVLAIEQEFGLTFESYHIAELTSVSSIVSALLERGGLS